jgi:hypothetical protein
LQAFISRSIWRKMKTGCAGLQHTLFYTLCDMDLCIGELRTGFKSRRNRTKR